MGVRGKIEAVLYAAEEPVTLAQLAALFGDEALAEQPAEPQPEQLTLAAEEEASANDADDADDAAPSAPEAVAALEADAETVAETGTVTAPDTPDAADAREQARAAKQQERARREAVRTLLEGLIAAYAAEDRGMEIREIAGGYRVGTKPEYHDAVRSFAKSLKPPMKLSLQALETLAVIAYKQPVTAPEVAEIRGVDSGGVLGSLMSRKLVTTAGRKQVLGRPILYKTTREFLLRFGLKDLNELPSMEEFEKMAGELRALGEEAEPLAAVAAAPEDETAGLQAPGEPELSIIVEDEAPEAEPGIQIEPDGTAVPENAGQTPAVPDEGGHG